MNYRCTFCLQDFAWESGSYQYVRSMILMHLGRCSTYGARSLSAGERTAEAARLADELFVIPTQRERPERRVREDRPQKRR